MSAQQALSKQTRVVLGAVGLFGMFAIVQLLLQFKILDAGTLPLPTAILGRMFSLLGEGALWTAIGQSLIGAAIGLFLGIVAGVVLGSLLGTARWARTFIQPGLEVVRTLPGIALAPIFIVIFGRGILSRSLTVGLACTWPILFNTEYGFAGVSRTAQQTARAFGENTMGIVRRVSLPWASPFIFTGIRLAASLALIVEITVEILIPDATGIGGFIIDRAQDGTGDLESVYAATIVAGLLSLGVNFGLRYLDGRWFGWRKGLEA